MKHLSGLGALLIRRRSVQCQALVSIWRLTPRYFTVYGLGMLPDIQQLLVLQDRDQRIRNIKIELKHAPLERAEVEGRLSAANSGLEQARQKARELEVQKNKLDVEAQSKRDQIGRFRGQQMQTRKNEEFQALAHEITHFEGEIQKIEDRELEVMEEIEKMKPVLAEAEKVAAFQRGLVATQLSDLDAKQAALKATLSQVEAERATLATEIDEDLLDRYNRLFASKGGNAIVPLEHEVCMGCHMKLTTQTAVRVKGGHEITNCEQCGRILYFPA